MSAWGTTVWLMYTGGELSSSQSERYDYYPEFQLRGLEL